MPELVILLFVSLIYLVPIAFVVWLAVTVVRMRVTLQSLEAKMDTLLRERRS